MFAIGERVLYPMYGAGVIEEIEDKLVDGIKTVFYVLKISVGNLKVVISVNKAEEKGIRTLLSPDKVLEIIEKTDAIDMPNNWNLRYKENLERLKSGDLKTEVEVYKTLILRERIKMLSSTEKKMLLNAKQIIVSEIMLSQNVDKPNAERILLESVEKTA
ncbi:MAG: CarD family transcriptional regulator [Firmicutes bacterium]|nr:CarD family transcriptional regulator [Bacillota bacterium]MBQ9603941.1 CarD family transcriptional regulator [Bacillota bacterium]